MAGPAWAGRHFSYVANTARELHTFTSLMQAQGKQGDPRTLCTGAMNTVGYEYITRDQWPEGWEQTVAQAAGEFDQAILGEKQKLLERINTNRLQLKFARSVAALPPAICACVKELEGRMRTLCGDGVADGLMLQDCYALLTPADETDEEARSPQKWHLDAITRFPVAALVLRGGRCTEFSVGAYSDFSAGVAPATLERWTAPLKNIHVRSAPVEPAAQPVRALAFRVRARCSPCRRARGRATRLRSGCTSSITCTRHDWSRAPPPRSHSRARTRSPCGRRPPAPRTSRPAPCARGATVAGGASR